MSEGNRSARQSVIEEITHKIRTSIAVIVFVILTLFAVILRYLFPPAAEHLAFIPEASFPLITGIALALAAVGLFYSTRIFRQMVRIIRDYANRLERILDVTRELREEVHGDILLEKIMDAALSITDSEAGAILLREGDRLAVKVIRGGAARADSGDGRGTGIAGWVAKTGEPLRVGDVRSDARFDPGVDAVAGVETRSLLCVPLKTSSAVIGVVELFNKKGGHTYRERDEEIGTYLAEQAAISIIKTKFHEDQKNYEIHLTDMLLETIDFHIPEKRGHSRRVARYSNLIAKGLNMPEAEKKRLYFASLLHDVGFLKIHSDNAFKREEFMRHPTVGYEMISPINFYADIAPFILYHHERYDGHGYPARLKGEAIPLESRIIHIAESFDAMVSTNSYQVPVSFGAAVEELRRRSGTQFDQELVEIFLGNIDPRHVTP